MFMQLTGCIIALYCIRSNDMSFEIAKAGWLHRQSKLQSQTVVLPCSIYN